METLIVRPKNQKQMATVEAVLKALNVAFQKEEKTKYNPEFVAKILEGSKEIAEGKGTKIALEDLWK
ncbi:DUF2683 family protein [uncultured Mucilaginibacter sp.]|uniref:DUF2683 family protein n=1 Tax=uncultured Mucilaginibacter sp. TaxID=797541 RepID=UPI00260B657B|nr:DUF2683 family protein [uncultured Mucilaginibacter sp.]